MHKILLYKKCIFLLLLLILGAPFFGAEIRFGRCVRKRIDGKLRVLLIVHRNGAEFSLWLNDTHFMSENGMKGNLISTNTQYRELYFFSLLYALVSFPGMSHPFIRSAGRIDVIFARISAKMQ